MHRYGFGECTDPPLNAPTGRFTTGTATASCNDGLVVWIDLERNGEGVLTARVFATSRGSNAREAIIAEEEGTLDVETCPVEELYEGLVTYSFGWSIWRSRQEA